MPWPAACLSWDSTAKPSSCTKLASKKERYESWCNMRYGIFILQWFSERRDCASYLILPQLPSLPPKYFLCHPFFASISFFGMGCSQAVRSDKKAGGQGEAGYLIFCTSVLRPAFSSASSILQVSNAWLLHWEICSLDLDDDPRRWGYKPRKRTAGTPKNWWFCR